MLFQPRVQPIVGRSIQFFEEGKHKYGRIVKIEPISFRNHARTALIKRKLKFNKTSVKEKKEWTGKYRYFVLESPSSVLSIAPVLSITQTLPSITTNYSRNKFFETCKYLRNELNQYNILSEFKERIKNRPFTTGDLANYIFDKYFKKEDLSKDDINLYDNLFHYSFELIQSNWDIIDALEQNTFIFLSSKDIKTRQFIKGILNDETKVSSFTNLCLILKDWMEKDPESREVDSFKSMFLSGKNFQELIHMIILRGKITRTLTFMSREIFNKIMYPIYMTRSHIEMVNFLRQIGVEVELDTLFYYSPIKGSSDANIIKCTKDINEDYKDFDIDNYIDERKDISQNEVDLTHLKNIMIQNEDNKYIYFSIDENDPSTLYVHIDDVTKYIQLNDIVDLNSRKRMFSMKLTHKYYPMVHPDLKNKLLDDITNNIRNVISFKIKINEENGYIENYEILLSKINNITKLNHKDVTLLCDNNDYNHESQDIIRKLYQLIKPRIKYDQSFTKKKVILKNNNPIIENNIISTSQLILNELERLCGEITANFCYENNIDIPYIISNEDLLTIEPREYHCTSITSPLERYPDMIVHYQLKHFLINNNDKFPFSRVYIKEFIETQLNNEIEKISNLTKLIEDYWKERYIRNRKGDELSLKFEATIINITQSIGKTMTSKPVYHKIRAIIDELNWEVNIFVKNYSDIRVNQKVVIYPVYVKNTLLWDIYSINKDNN